MIVGIYKIHAKKINIKNRVYNYYFDNLIKAKKIETENNLMDEKNYKDLVIYFTRYIHSKSLKTLSMYYHGLMTKTEEHEGIKKFHDC